jgi:enoyl-CoA hydratase/carnithine racemase
MTEHGMTEHGMTEHGVTEHGVTDRGMTAETAVASAAETAVASAAVTCDRPSPGVLRITLQRPPANALGLPLIDGLNAALDHAACDDGGGIKIIIVASAVPGFFAAGADIKHMSAVDAESFAAYGEALRAVLARLAAPEWISVAAVDGLALGGGLELAMACTLRVAGTQARFGLPEVKLGLIPGAGGTQRLPRLIGRGRALDIMLTGRQVPAAEAHAIGLVDRLVDAGRAAEEALTLAGELNGCSLPAQQAVIAAVDASFEMPLADGLRYEAAREQRLFETGEAREGIAAFLAKRRPVFR